MFPGDEGFGDVGLDPQGNEQPGGYEEAMPEPADSGEGTPDDGDGGESFYDPSQVPAELQPTFREMKKAYTQKTQAVAESRRVVEEQMRQTALGYQKQVVFDQLMQDPRVLDFLHRLESPSGVGSEDPSEADPIMQQAIERVTAPIRQRLEHLQGQLSQQTQFAEFQRNHSDWDAHKDGMQKAWEQDRLAGRQFRPYEDAYNWAVVQRVRTAQVSQQRRRQQQPAGVERGGVSKQVSTNQPKLDVPRQEAFRNAVDWALEQHGIDRKTLNTLGANRLPLK